MLEVSISASHCDSRTGHIAGQIYGPLKQISSALNDTYGGRMEKLWITIELAEAQLKRSEPWSFRLQKRVSGRCQLTGLKGPDSFNVGHYSVRPDILMLLSLREEQVVSYILGLVFDSLESLRGKKSLKGFDLEAFQRAFVKEAKYLGYDIQ